MDNIQGNLAIDLDTYYTELLDEQIGKENNYNAEKYADKFAIQSDKQADLYLDKLRSIDITHLKYKDSVTAKINFLKEKQNELEKLLKAELVDTENRKSFYVKLLGEYFDILPKESKKELKTQYQYKLASGNLVKMKSTQSIKLVDRTALLTEVMINGQDEYVKVEHDVDWAALKGHLNISEGGKIVNNVTGEWYEGTSIVIETIPEKLEINYKL
jgi:hypothetical protein